MKKAIVLGGTHDHIRLMELLKQRDYYVILIDYLDAPPAKPYSDFHNQVSTLNKELVLELAREECPDLIISACIDQSLLTMAYVSEKMSLPCHIPFETALLLTEKSFMKNIIVNNKIPTSKYSIIDGNRNEQYKNNLSYPLIVKPVDSNSSKGVLKLSDSSNLETSISYAMSFSRTRKVIIEEFVDGQEFSADVVIKDSVAKLLMVTKNVKVPSNYENFTICQNFFPATENMMIINRIEQIAQNLSDIFKIQNGPLIIQFICNQDGDLFVIELSSRIGGGSKHFFIKEITGFDILDFYLNTLSNIQSDIRTEHKYRYGCMNYLYTGNGIIDRYVNFDALKQEKIIHEYFIYKPPYSKVTQHLSSNDRAVGYMVLSDDHNTLVNKIDAADSRVKILDSNGKDIMIHRIFDEKYLT